MMKISAPRISLRMSRSSDDVDRLCRGFCAQRLNETREIQIPSDKVGLIIGSRGATIRGLQQNAERRRAHLELIQPRERGEAWVVIRANSVDNADFLEQEVKRIIEPGEIDVTYEHSVEIEIPSDKVGLIIGSKGATIKRLQRDAKKHGAHLELIQPRQQGQAGRVVIKANDTGVADFLEAEVKRTARLIEPDDASTLSVAATAENRRRSRQRKPSFGIVPWTKVGERFYCLVQV